MAADDELMQNYPITTALAAAGVALGTGAPTGIGDVGKKAVVDADEGLKGLIKAKFGPSSDAAEAVDKLEKQPEREDRKATVAKELELAKATLDPELLAAAKALLELIEAAPGGVEMVKQVATGNYIAQAADGSTATVNVGERPKTTS